MRYPVGLGAMPHLTLTCFKADAHQTCIYKRSYSVIALGDTICYICIPIESYAPLAL